MSEKFTNTIYTGDNIYVMNGMNSESVDLIYLDPPFNTKRFYAAPVGSKAAGAEFKDMWTWDDVNIGYLERLIGDYPFLVRYIESIEAIHGKPMMSYITYMTQRIIEMHRILKNTGSMYLHCDPTASHYLKIVLDRIFGKNNFHNEIIWQRIQGAGKTSQHKSKSYGRSSDTLLFYTKSNIYKFDDEIIKTAFDTEYLAKNFPYKDDVGRYKRRSPFRPPGLGERPNLCYKYKEFVNPHLSGWTVNKEKLMALDKAGELEIVNGKIYRKQRPSKGYPINNIWTDIPQAMSKSEKTGYPTQKPLALLERIIKASSNEGDVVFDPFCGCATTLAASERLKRNWIGIDIEEQAAKLIVSRLSDATGLFRNFVHRKDTPKRTDVRIEKPNTSIKERLFKEQKGLCNACHLKCDYKNFEIDHIVPKSKGGGDYYENYQLLCGNCNRTKGNRTMEYLRGRIKAYNAHFGHLTFGGK